MERLSRQDMERLVDLGVLQCSYKQSKAEYLLDVTLDFVLPLLAVAAAVYFAADFLGAKYGHLIFGGPHG